MTSGKFLYPFQLDNHLITVEIEAQIETEGMYELVVDGSPFMDLKMTTVEDLRAMLLAAIAPELRDGYVRYYVEQANIRRSGMSAYNTLFDDGFALPPAIREALQRQIDIILSGI